VGNDGSEGARWIDVDPERLAGWVESFEQRHGPGSAGVSPEAVTFRAADGAVAECHMPFPPLAEILREGHPESPTEGLGQGHADGPGQGHPESPTEILREGHADSPGQGYPESGAESGNRQVATPGWAEWAERMAAHARAERVVAVFLVRLGGYAAGVFTGPAPRLAASKVGSRLVHGRSAAGGTSQHRFARRREKQATEALGAAAATAAAVFGPYAGRIDAVVLGGDRRAMAALRDDPRLVPYLGLAVERFLTVPDPRLTVLRSAPRLFRAIRIRLSGPA
jgi:hypothetical protein